MKEELHPIETSVEQTQRRRAHKNPVEYHVSLLVAGEGQEAVEAGIKDLIAHIGSSCLQGKITSGEMTPQVAEWAIQRPRNADTLLLHPSYLEWVALRQAQAERLSEAKLSGQEFRVARLLSEGANREQIRKELGVTLNTVKTHISRVYRKTGCKTPAEVRNFIGI